MQTPYRDPSYVQQAVEEGRHRDLVGGLWDEMGALQLAFLRAHGLEPRHRLLDIGCGCLRAGVRLIRYLEAGHYWGTDIHEPLLDAGFDIELTAAGIQGRLDRRHLVHDADFGFVGVEGPFDFALAQSVFTHLEFNWIRICLERLSPLMAPKGRLFATFFEVPDDLPTYAPLHHEPGGAVTQGAGDPVHYRASDLAYAASGLPWRYEYLGGWDHPRDQRMVIYHRS